VRPARRAQEGEMHMNATAHPEPAAKLRLGVSACLLGEKVRFDAGHKQDRWVTDVLGPFVEFVPVCPEVEIGLGVPRESIRLQGTGTHVRLVAPKSGADLTPKMTVYADKRSGQLARQNLAGFVLKKDSPSCGLERVRVYDRQGVPARTGRGLFAAALLDRVPALPVEEEGRLNDPRLRENFVTRIFAHQRWVDLERGGITRARLFRFHEQHKFLLLAHSQAGMRRLGHLLGASGARADARDLGGRYLEEFAAAMTRVPTPKNHTNVLQHVAGFFSPRLDAGDRAELTQTIHEYRLGRLPLVVPLTLVRHYVRKLQVPYLLDQVYLNPHPDELMLLNHV
jgi:uncharacterized protein YbgA (DUF1722 family)/uncharacterized protein YbbK (DUF523 family)